MYEQEDAAWVLICAAKKTVKDTGCSLEEALARVFTETLIKANKELQAVTTSDAKTFKHFFLRDINEFFKQMKE